MTPSSILDPLTAYTITFDDVCDHAGNKLTGDLLSFSTGDGPVAGGGPILQSITPASGASGVAVDTNIVLVFDRDIDDRTAAPPVVTGGVPIDTTHTVVGNTLTITPDADLAPATSYQVQTGWITDLNNTARWQGYQSFTTQ